MATWESQETRFIAVTSADKSQNFVKGLTGVYLIADADCFVDFDRPATVSSSFLVKANTFYRFDPLLFTVLHAVASGTANLYIVGVRSRK